MKIVSIEAFALQIPLAEPYWGSQAWGGQESDADRNSDAVWHGYPAVGRLQPAYDDGICTVIVKVVADGGLVGWGEAKAPVVPRVAQTRSWPSSADSHRPPPRASLCFRP